MVAENTIMTVVWGRQGLCSYRELPAVAPRSRLAGRESVSSAERTPEPVSSEAPDGFGQGTVHAPFTIIGIVGIGAWAGGLAAFTKLLGPLTSDSGMAFVFVQHQDPRHTSHLASILAKRGPRCP